MLSIFDCLGYSQLTTLCLKLPRKTILVVISDKYTAEYYLYCYYCLSAYKIAFNKTEVFKLEMNGEHLASIAYSCTYSKTIRI